MSLSPRRFLSSNEARSSNLRGPSGVPRKQERAFGSDFGTENQFHGGICHGLAHSTQRIFAWTWSAVLAGVFASLVVQILLTMLGFGIGLLAIDIPTATASPAGAGWAAFVWRAVSGIIAAFIGGAVAAANSPDQRASGGSVMPSAPGRSQPWLSLRRRR
jgi:hypothetical protein